MDNTEKLAVHISPAVSPEAEAWLSGDLPSEEYFQVVRDRQRAIAVAELTEINKQFYVRNVIRRAGRTVLNFFEHDN